MGHVLEQGLPLGVHGGGLVKPLHRLDHGGIEIVRGRCQDLHHQADLATSPQAKPDQIPGRKPGFRRSGVGEDTTLTTGLHPDLDPEGVVDVSSGVRIRLANPIGAS